MLELTNNNSSRTNSERKVLLRSVFLFLHDDGDDLECGSEELNMVLKEK
jgi:hypothetical protein